MLQEKFVALIRDIRSTKTSILPHRPQTPSIHRRMHTTREGELPGKIILLQIISIRAVEWRVQPFEGEPRGCREVRLALRSTCQHWLDNLCLPAFLLCSNFLVI